MRRELLLIIALFIPSMNLYGSDEHTACTTTAYHWFQHTAAELRTIASSCEAPLFSELNFHRAYYRDLVNEGTTASSLIDFARSDHRSNFSAYTFHMVLSEQMARHYFTSTIGQLLFLIEEYEVNNEIAELRLRGYNNLANRLSELQSRREAPE